MLEQWRSGKACRIRRACPLACGVRPARSKASSCIVRPFRLDGGFSGDGSKAKDLRTNPKVASGGLPRLLATLLGLPPNFCRLLVSHAT